MFHTRIKQREKLYFGVFLVLVSAYRKWAQKGLYRIVEFNGLQFPSVQLSFVSVVKTYF